MFFSKYIQIAKEKHKEGNLYQANEIYKKDGVVKLNENTLGGSILTMNKAFKNLLEIGFSINTYFTLLSIDWIAN